MITVASIANASELELVCFTYEILLEDLQKSIDASSIEEETEYRNHAKQVIGVLTENLYFESDMAKDLFMLYVYVQKLLIVGKEKADLREAHKLIKIIATGYEVLLSREEKQQNAGAMANAQDIYAGMTYGKGQLTEMLVENNSRGFKA